MSVLTAEELGRLVQRRAQGGLGSSIRQTTGAGGGRMHPLWLRFVDDPELEERFIWHQTVGNTPVVRRSFLVLGAILIFLLPIDLRYYSGDTLRDRLITRAVFFVWAILIFLGTYLRIYQRPRVWINLNTAVAILSTPFLGVFLHQAQRSKEPLESTLWISILMIFFTFVFLKLPFYRGSVVSLLGLPIFVLNDYFGGADPDHIPANLLVLAGLVGGIGAFVHISEARRRRDFWRRQLLRGELEATASAASLNNRLLLNVLPRTILARLKRGETRISEKIDKASVAFITLVIPVTHVDSPTEHRMEVCDALFSAFDDEMQKDVFRNRLEKIKSIGSMYMLTAGVPRQRPGDAVCLAKYLVKVQEIVAEYAAKNNNRVQASIGAHTGEIVSGVLGTSKPTFDVFGDSVNLASRFNGTCPPGSIHVSEAFADEVESHFDITRRAPIPIKGKGKLVSCLLTRKGADQHPTTAPAPASSEVVAPVTSSREQSPAPSDQGGTSYALTEATGATGVTQFTAVANEALEFVEDAERRVEEVYTESVHRLRFKNRALEDLYTLRVFREASRFRKMHFVALSSGVVVNGIRLHAMTDVPHVLTIARWALVLPMLMFVLPAVSKRSKRYRIMAIFMGVFLVMSFVFVGAIACNLGALDPCDITDRHADFVFIELALLTTYWFMSSPIKARPFGLSVGLTATASSIGLMLFLGQEQQPVLYFAVAMCGVYGMLMRDRLMRQVAVLRDIREKERDKLSESLRRSDELIQSLFPPGILELVGARFMSVETKEETGKDDRKWMTQFQDVGILVSDLKGFTSFASACPSDRVVALLDSFFRSTDDLTQILGACKVTTIGDAYVSATPLTGNWPLEERLVRLVLLAHGMHAVLADHAAQYEASLEMRIGMGVGAVLGSILGRSKLSYDFSGAPVDQANLLEQSARPGTVLVSAEIRDCLAQHSDLVARIAAEAGDRLPVGLRGVSALAFQPSVGNGLDDGVAFEVALVREPAVRGIVGAGEEETG